MVPVDIKQGFAVEEKTGSERKIPLGYKKKGTLYRVADRFSHAS
jgi:hypothetical protein